MARSRRPTPSAILPAWSADGETEEDRVLGAFPVLLSSRDPVAGGPRGLPGFVYLSSLSTLPFAIPVKMLFIQARRPEGKRMRLEKNTRTNTQQYAKLPGTSPDCQRSQDLVPPEQRGEEPGDWEPASMLPC